MNLLYETKAQEAAKSQEAAKATEDPGPVIDILVEDDLEIFDAVVTPTPTVYKTLIPARKKRVVTPPKPMSMTIQMEPESSTVEMLADPVGYWFQGNERRNWKLVCCKGMETIVLGDSMLKV